MGRNQREATLCEMTRQSFGYVRRAGCIEIGERFVEHPQARSGQEYATQGHAPSLSGRKHAAKEIRTVGNSEIGQDGRDLLSADAAFEPDAEMNIFRCREIALESSVVRQIGERLQESNAGVAAQAAIPVDFALLRLQQSAHHAQQARLTDSIRSRDVQRFTGADRERNTAQDMPLTAPEMEVRRLEKGCFGHAVDRRIIGRFSVAYSYT